MTQQPASGACATNCICGMCVFVFVSQCAASICIADQQVPKLPEAAVQPLPWAPFANSDHCLIIISVAITIILTSWPPPGTTLQKCSTNAKTNYQTISKQTSVMDHLYGTLQRGRSSQRLLQMLLIIFIHQPSPVQQFFVTLCIRN